jgi:hypothetical protein
MRNLVIEELMALIDAGFEVYGSAVEPITDLKTLESMSNRDLLTALMDALE